MSLRSSAIAGVFYPANKSALDSMVGNLLENKVSFNQIPKILISPHAGYIFSGGVAAYGYNQLKNLNRDEEYRVVLIGPSHRVYFHGLAFSPASFFETPLGLVKVDLDTAKEFIDNSPFAFFNEEAHKFEHSLETQLPFLQTLLQNFSIVPIVYSECEAIEIQEALEFFLADKNTIAIISADLSHFHSYLDAKQIDIDTIDMIEKGNATGLTHEQTCGKSGICAAVNYAKKHNLKEKTLDYKNSGDVSDDKGRVVGYMSAIFYNSEL